MISLYVGQTGGEQGISILWIPAQRDLTVALAGDRAVCDSVDIVSDAGRGLGNSDRIGGGAGELGEGGKAIFWVGPAEGAGFLGA
jgi:hypothetical protein